MPPRTHPEKKLAPVIDPGKVRQGSVPIEQIVTRSDQPRTFFDVANSQGLKESIKTNGILEPLLVRPRGQLYEVVCGERRYRAALALEIKLLPVRVVELTDDQAFLIALHENLHRDNLTVIDEAQAYRRLLDQGIASTMEEVARLVGVSRPRVSQRLALLDMPEEVVTRLRKCSDPLRERHARALRRVNDIAAQIALAEEISTKKLTVEETEERVRGLAKTGRRGRPRSRWVVMGGLRYKLQGWRLIVEVGAGDNSAKADALAELARVLRSAGRADAP